MVWARINTAHRVAPKVVQPRVGRLVRVGKAVRYSPSHEPPEKGTLGMVQSHNDHYIGLQKPDGVVSIMKMMGSELHAVTKAEAEAHREELRKNPQSIPLKGVGPTGTDPEVFVLNGEGKVLPAWLFLPDKKKPINFFDPGRDDKSVGCAFYDGFQAEFTVPAFGCHGYGCDYVRKGLNFIWNEAIKKDKKATLTHHCVLDIDEADLATAPKDGADLGCDPSLNAYREGPNPVLAGIDPAGLKFRFAGCHIHFGCGVISDKNAVQMIKLLDAMAGVGSVLILRGLEDERRRMYYGQAGEYRRPGHGIEWRVPSSAALVHPTAWHAVFELARFAAQMSASGNHHYWTADDEEVQQAVNNLDIELATKIMERNNKVLRVVMRNRLAEKASNNLLALLEKGAKALLPVKSMVSNWRLDEDWADHSNGGSVFLSTANF